MSHPLPQSVAALSRDRVSQSGDRPFLTYYDDTSGERTELSHATFDNWASKTANLLAEEFEVGRGHDVAIGLGSHWTTAAIVFGCWKAGARVLLGADRGSVAFFDEAGAAAADPASGRVVVGSGMGGRLSGPPVPGALAYGEEVLAYGDDVEDSGAGLDDDALLLRDEAGLPIRLTQRNVLAAAAALAEWGLGPRLLLTRSLRSVEGLVLGLLGPYLAGGSVVLVNSLRPSTLWSKAGDERVTDALVPWDTLDVLPAPTGQHGIAHLLCPAGAPADTVRRAEQRLRVGVTVGHGLAAATGASTLTPADAGPELRPWLARSAAPTVGTATSRAEVAILDADGRSVGEGDRGEVCVRGEVVTPDAGEWLHSGDEGFTDTGPDGRSYVFLSGRVL